MPDNRPPSSIDSFLLRNGFEPTTPLRNVVPQPQPQQSVAPPRPSPSGDIAVSGRNFLRPEDRKSWVTPAGTSQFGPIEDPFPDRKTTHQLRMERAQLAQQIERESRLSGSATMSNPKQAIRDLYGAPQLERDAAGRIFQRFERFTPGADIF